MTDTAGDIRGIPVHSAAAKQLLCCATITFGSTGAIASVDSDDPRLTLGALTTGVGALTYPKAVRARITFTLESPATSAVTECVLLAQDAAAGTATIQTSKAGTPANPASGDKLHIVCVLQSVSAQ